MKEKEEIIIKIKDGEGKISIDNYDIRDIKFLLENIENIIVRDIKKHTIALEIKEGSIINSFKTTVQIVTLFAKDIESINQEGSIHFLEDKKAIAIGKIQQKAKTDKLAFEISTSLEKSPKCIIDSTTNYFIEEKKWGRAEYYLYGIVTDAGGKNRPNIHLETKEYGSLKIAIDEKKLKELDKNILYKLVGINAEGEQNLLTGEINKEKLKFIKFLSYNPTYDKKYLEECIKKGTESWKGVNTEDWIENLRGSYNGV